MLKRFCRILIITFCVLLLINEINTAYADRPQTGPYWKQMEPVRARKYAETMEPERSESDAFRALLTYLLVQDVTASEELEEVSEEIRLGFIKCDSFVGKNDTDWIVAGLCKDYTLIMVCDESFNFGTYVLQENDNGLSPEGVAALESIVSEMCTEFSKNDPAILSKIEKYYQSHEGKVPPTYYLFDKPVLKVSLDSDKYNYGDIAEVSAIITYPDGSTEGLETMYPNATMKAILLNADGHKVKGFIEQSSKGTSIYPSFPMADDTMKPGEYKILIKSNVEGLTAETETFFYTGMKTYDSNLTNYTIELTLNKYSFADNDEVSMTAKVTDSKGNPRKGIKVDFSVLNTNGTYSRFFGEYDIIWHLTNQEGKATLQGRMEKDNVFLPGKYIVQVSIDGTTIIATKQIEYLGTK